MQGGKKTADHRAVHGGSPDNLAERNFAYACCRRYWWFSAVPEIVVGLWAVAAATVILLFNKEGTLGIATSCLLVLTLLLFWGIPRYLNDSFLIPSGLCLKAPTKSSTNWTIAGATAVLYIAIIVIALVRFHSIYPAVAGVIGLIFVVAYLQSGNIRHLLEGVWVALCVAATTMVGDVFHNTGVEFLGTALIFAGAGLLVIGCRVFFKMVFDLVRAPDPDAVPAPDDEPMSRNWFTLNELQDALASKDRRLRYLCVTFLCEYARPQMLPELIKATHDEDAFVAQAARRAITNIWGPDPDEIMRIHINSRFGRRMGKGKLLTAEQIKDLDKRQKVLERETIAHEQEVEKVLCTRIGTDENALATLIDLAEDAEGPDRGVNLVAMELLGATHSHRAYATLIQLIMKGDRSITGNAVEGFRGAASGAIIHIEPLFSDAREWVRVAGVNAGIGLLSDLQSNDKVDATVALEMLREDTFRLIHHPHPVTRAMSLELLTYYGQEAIDPLEEFCKDSFAMVRGEAVRVLTLLNAEIARSYVLQALSDQRAFVRATAINCAAYLKLSDALPAVLELTQDSDREVATLAQRLIFISKAW